MADEEPPKSFLLTNNLVPIAVAVLIGGAMFIKESPFASIEGMAALEQREHSNHESESKEIEEIKNDLDRRFSTQFQAIRRVEDEADVDKTELTEKFEHLLAAHNELKGEFEERDKRR